MDPGTVVMKQSNRYLCCGDTAGKVHLGKLLFMPVYDIVYSQERSFENGHTKID